MPSIYDLKPAFQNLLRPFLSFLARRGVTANHVTIFAVLLSAAAGAAIYLRPEAAWPLFCLPAVLVLRMALNAIDGLLAREFDMKTHLGAILNELGDVVSDALLYLPFARIAGISDHAIVAIVVMAVIAEMTGVIGVQIGGVRRYDGPMGKSDRALVFGVLALALGFGLKAYFWINVFLAVVALLLAVTIINRATRALKDANHAH